MDINKVYALLEWEEIGDIRLSSWAFDFLTDIAELNELGKDAWTENQSAKVDEIYSEKCP